MEKSLVFFLYDLFIKIKKQCEYNNYGQNNNE